jgi:hypothetical protein
MKIVEMRLKNNSCEKDLQISQVTHSFPLSLTLKFCPKLLVHMSFQLYFYISTDQNTLVYIYALISGNGIYGVDYESNSSSLSKSN